MDPWNLDVPIVPVDIRIGEEKEQEDTSILTPILIAAIPTIIGGYILHLLTKKK